MAVRALDERCLDGPRRGRSVLVLLAGVLLGFAIVAAGALTVIETGAFNATASKPHEWLVGWAVHAAFVNSARLRSTAVESPAQFTPAQVAAGLHRYAADCEVCHGGPAVARAPWTSGINPTPPFLLDAARRWTPAQLYFIVSEGIKMTAMPAWGDIRSKAELWDIVAFLEALPGLSPQDYARFKELDRRGAAPIPPS